MQRSTSQPDKLKMMSHWLFKHESNVKVSNIHKKKRENRICICRWIRNSFNGDGRALAEHFKTLSTFYEEQPYKYL